MADKHDFSQGSVAKSILGIAFPMMIAQLVQVLYNVVDRVYIGHMDGSNALALTGLGLTFPVVTLIAAFTNLFGTGGAPLCSIARGEGDKEKAEKIMGNTFTCLILTAGLLMIFFYAFKRPILFLFGASDNTFPFANEYLNIYLLGTFFAVLGTGMNGFINAQGFASEAMITTLSGALLNIALDPLFIFGLGLGIRGAAIATVISQAVSCAWVLHFLTSKRALLNLKRANMVCERKMVSKIAGLGLSGFMMQATNGLVQIACNATLQNAGGDLYVGIMTVLNSVRDMLSLPALGLSNGAQPVLGFNYGAKKYSRVKAGIRFAAITCIAYTLIIWGFVFAFPGLLIRIFNSDPALLTEGIPAIRLYFFGFFMMALQFSGQSTFVALGLSKKAVFFSLLRKAIIVVPLTVLLPLTPLGVTGVYAAEPISNFIGGLACFLTMLFTVYFRLPADGMD